MAELVFDTILQSKDIYQNQVLEEIENIFSLLEKLINEGVEYLKAKCQQEQQLLNQYQAQKAQFQNMLTIVDMRINDLESIRRSLQAAMNDCDPKEKAGIARELANVNRQLNELRKEKARLTNNIRIYTEVIKLQEEYLKMLNNANRFYTNAYEDLHKTKTFVNDTNKELLKQLDEIIDLIRSYYQAPQSLGVSYSENDYLKIDKSILKDAAKNTNGRIKALDNAISIINKADKSFYDHQDNVFDSVHDGYMNEVDNLKEKIAYLDEAHDIFLQMYEYLEKYDDYAKKEIKVPKNHKNTFKTSNDTALMEGTGILAWLLMGAIFK